MNILEEIIFPAVEEYNKTFNQSGQIQKSKDAPLSGQGAPLDSLELVNFIVVVEGKIRAVTGKDIRLVTDEALSRKSSPFQTLGSLEKLLADTLGSANPQ